MSEYIEEGINGQWTDWKFEAENYRKMFEQLQQENKQLKEELKIKQDDFKCANEEINQLKEVIEEVREYTEELKPHWLGNDLVLNIIDDLLQILDKVKEKENE